MTRKKSIAFLIIAFFAMICLLVVFIYPKLKPVENLNGQVSYTLQNAKVMVQGKVNGAKGQQEVDYPAATISTDNFTATKVTDKQTQYLDYSENANLSVWKIEKLKFDSDKSGKKDIKIEFKITNLSTTNLVKVSFVFEKPDEELESANVKRVISSNEAVISKNGGSREFTITFSVKNKDKVVNGDDIFDLAISFEKIELPANAVNVINLNSGKVTMGKVNAIDVEWKCFAYSMDGETWTKLDSGQSIPEGAKFGYFVLDTYLEKLNKKAFVSSDNVDYVQDSGEDKFYIKEGVNGVASSNTVPSNDYYYSDVRQILKSLDTELNISSDNDIYRAIQGRTLADLYKQNLASWNDPEEKYDTSNQVAPSGATMTDVDAFWLMSIDEIQKYFADENACKWMNGDSGVYYWLRSACSGNTTNGTCVTSREGLSFYLTDYSIGVRPAFKLNLV